MLNIDVEEERFFAGGFTENRAQINDCLIFNYYMTDATQLISAQVSIVKRAPIFDDLQKKSDVVKNLNELLRMESVVFARQMFKNHRLADVRWCDTIEDKETSIFGFIKLYCEK